MGSKRREQGDASGVHEFDVGELKLQSVTFEKVLRAHLAQLVNPRANDATLQMQDHRWWNGFTFGNLKHRESKVDGVEAMAGVSIPPACEMLTELFSGAVQHDPQIALGYFHLRADFVVRALFNFVKLEHLRDSRW